METSGDIRTRWVASSANPADTQAPTQVVEDLRKVKTKLVIDFTQRIKELFCLLSPPHICLFMLVPANAVVKL